ncbi:MAG TPA: hypothetical protein VLJ39_08185, partial [Tepidisphaeraceae bacterium]|nr:hypothetical protein [Tepidisphaeraceae bacterium]
DLTEFMQTIPDYPLEPRPADAGGGGGGLGTPQAAARPTNDSAASQQKVETLLKLITETVAPDTWRENGGALGALRAIGTQLVVSQTAENHKQIKVLLDQMVSTSVLVEIDARWELLTSEQLDEWRGKNEAEAAGLLAKFSNDADAQYCRGRVVGFNGQTVSLTSGLTSTVVTNATPVVGTGVAAYDLQTAREQSGVSLQVTPRLAPGRDGLVVDVHSTVVEDVTGTGRPLLIAAPQTQPAGAGAAAQAATGQPNRLEASFNTTVRLTSGVPMIIGGMTREPGKSGSRQVCLILTARTINPPAK